MIEEKIEESSKYQDIEKKENWKDMDIKKIISNTK